MDRTHDFKSKGDAEGVFFSLSFYRWYPVILFSIYRLKAYESSSWNCFLIFVKQIGAIWGQISMHHDKRATLPLKIPCWRILPAISLRLHFKMASWHVLHGSFTNDIGQWGSRGPYWGPPSGWQVQEPHFSLDPDRCPVIIQHTVELCATDFSTKCENQLCRLRFPLELGWMSIGKTNFLLMVKNSR